MAFRSATVTTRFRVRGAGAVGDSRHVLRQLHEGLVHRVLCVLWIFQDVIGHMVHEAPGRPRYSDSNLVRSSAVSMVARYSSMAFPPVPLLSMTLERAQI